MLEINLYCVIKYNIPRRRAIFSPRDEQNVQAKKILATEDQHSIEWIAATAHQIPSPGVADQPPGA